MANELKWDYKIIDKHWQDDALKEARDYINTNYKNMFNVKVASSDNSPGHARAIIFWQKLEQQDQVSGVLEVSTPPASVKWDYDYFKGSDFSSMAEKACNFLTGLTPYQQYYASVAFSNAANNDAFMSVWYPKSTTQVLSEEFFQSESTEGEK